VYWVAVAGRDPIALIAHYGDRLKLLHLKDRSTEPGGTFAPVGSGSLPWEPILQAARTTEWYMVEQDTSNAPLDDVRRSFEYMRDIVGG
jgi:sugar phosphate isomerase/epimerase